MNDKLDDKARADLISYRISKAEQTLDEADLLAANSYYNTAVNRLYYAAYYAASALMLGYSLDSTTHKGIKVMLGLKFIQPGILEREYGQIYQRLFNCRQASDYEDFVYYSKETYDELRPLSKKFIQRIKTTSTAVNNPKG